MNVLHINIHFQIAIKLQQSNKVATCFKISVYKVGTKIIYIFTASDAKNVINIKRTARGTSRETKMAKIITE